ncbi:hypothetical protein AXE85_00860 [Gemella sp. oral taxon 928]|uniref:hypothetical protein n=1 Tax=unclassified Gemella TaxID=2624949 RepID=UPI00076807E1|nr:MULTISPECIES: hypothetical protein [unclassified Gemella]AME08844.1 hypothetical protein AXE85_00860 [Gemella sp. oral taxon 928]AXI26413.1 hypothetical protein CG018_02615 [Gemella sp. ND 6198]
MVNWKKWFSEEDEDTVFEEKKVKEDNEFDIEFADDEGEIFSKNYDTSSDKDAGEDDLYLEDYEVLEDNEDDHIRAEKKVGFFDKLKNLFSTKDQVGYDDEDETLLEEFDDIKKDEKTEDYKTYLERQKKETTQSDNDIQTEEDDVQEQGGFLNSLKKLKDKLFAVSDKDIEKEELDTILDDFEEENNKAKDVEQETFEEEFETVQKDVDNSEVIPEHFNESEKTDTQNLNSTLRKLGVDDVEIKDVDIFADKTERRTHPTLAAVRTKRLKQDHQMDNLSNDLILEKDSKEFKENITPKITNTVEDSYSEQIKRNSKHQEERNQLNSDFNTIARKEDRVTSDIPLTKKEDDKLEKIFSDIKEKEEKTKEKLVEDIDVRELESIEDRREKLKYTSVDDVLEGSEDLFEDDIDRTSKKTIGENFEKENQLPTEDVMNFRKDVYQKNEEEPEKTELDNLIISENIDLANKKTKTLSEIEKLNSNLAELKKENTVEVSDTKKQISDEELIQRAAHIEDIEIEDYDEIKNSSKDILADYSDYHLDEDEIKELQKQNKIETYADDMDIDSLTREVAPSVKSVNLNNDIDKFVEEKTMPAKVKVSTAEQTETVEQTEDKENKEEDIERGIEYTEKLYSNEVDDYFKKSKGYTLGEYKTVDRGYRPVSKEKIENNQKILEAIFEKYSSNNLTPSKKSVTATIMETNTITPKAPVGKFKPTPVYSSVYGSGPRNIVNSNSTKKTTKSKLSQKKEEKSKLTDANLYKEIASQEETVWNIGSAKRVPKNKVKNKKTKK